MLHLEEELVKRLCVENAEFKRLFDEHISFEQDLEALYSLKYFPTEVENKIKEIKRRKLLGKDRMDHILSTYRSGTK